MGLELQIRTALEGALAPDHLDVINESHLHAGHAGDDGSGQSHWRVIISSKDFSSMTRLARHRAVHSALGPQIIGQLHALAIDIR